MLKKVSSLVAMGMFLTAPVISQAYPEKPLRIIVPFSAGTATDLLARDFGTILSERIGQPVVIENRTGAEGIVGVQAFLNAPADGYTTLFGSGSLAVLDPLIKKNLPYRPAKDFAPICSVGSIDNIMNISGALSIDNVSDFIAEAKAKPDNYTFAYSSALTRLAGELFQEATGVKLKGIPYRSSANGLTEVAGGVVDLFFIDHISAGPYYESGRVKPLVVAGDKRLQSFPEVPAASEVGVAGYDLTPLFSLYLPSKTPADITNRLREVVGETLKTEAMANMLSKRGLEPSALCGEDLVKSHATDTERLREVVQRTGMEVQ